MFYTIYQITHVSSGSIYIGKHQTTNLDDNYMGSGKLLKRAQEKHGLDQFEKIILHVFDNEEDMNAKEAELVTEEFCARSDTYNICPGGKGGWGYVNKNSLGIWKNNPGSNHLSKGGKIGGKVTVKIRLNRGLSPFGTDPSKSFLGKKHSKETKSVISEKAKNRLKDPTNNSQYGIIKSNETKRKISEKLQQLSNINCPHCEKFSKNKALMIRWHFDNCKKKII